MVDKAKFRRRRQRRAVRRSPKRRTWQQIAQYMRDLNPWEDIEEYLIPKVDHVLRKVAVDDHNYGMAEEVVESYAKRDTPFPPVVFNRHGLSDGRHRMEAARLRGDKTILAYVPLEAL